LSSHPPANCACLLADPSLTIYVDVNRTISRTALAHTLVWSVLMVLACPGLAAGQRYDPHLRFQTIETPHFLIHFHQGERELAERFVPIAEDVYARLTGPTGRKMPRTHVILSGQDDASNGWAATVPFNTIEIGTAWPGSSSSIGNTDDWLRMVFVHEYTHILHLDRSAGVMLGVRRVFGRMPLAMPNLFLPVWQVEGIATWHESAVTGAGRVKDGMARRIPATAARAGVFTPIDRAAGGLVSWPAGEAPYFYGALFHDYLAGRFGASTLETLAEQSARWPPLLGAFAFRTTYGASAGSLWKDFEASWRARVAGQVVNTGAAVQITHDGFQSGAPRWDPERGGALYYTRQTPNAFPALMRVATDTGEHTRIASRVGGNGIGVAPGRVVFDQLDLTRSVALQSDLYLIGTDPGHTNDRRLTRGARVRDPDLSADGRRVVCVVTEADRRFLATMDLDAAGQSTSNGVLPVPLVSEPGVYFSAPRWSPDGRRIAVERVRPGVAAEVVLVDVATGRVEPLAPGIGQRHATPAWTPDGRVVVVAAASGDEPFNLVAVSVEDRLAWQITSRAEGARAPDISADGSRIAFLGYTTRGEDVFVAPLDQANWTPIGAGTPAAPVPPASSASSSHSEPKPYSPVHGFVPRYWEPLVERDHDGWQLGASTSSSDALGRHAYAASLWFRTDANRLDGSLSYVYSRWRPLVFASASRESDAFEANTEETRSISAGVIVPFLRVRRSQQILASMRLEDRHVSGPAGQPGTVVRNAIQLGWALSTARAFGYSISPEEGGTVAVTSEHVLPGLGAGGRADAVVAEGRYYQRAGPPHATLALRVAGAMGSGNARARRRFTIGGSDAAGGLFDIGHDAIALFRGAPAGSVGGARAIAANADYRVPIWRIERGPGSLPVFARWLHAAVFTDVGDAWEPRDPIRWKVSVGVEASADIVVAYRWPIAIATGVAWVRDRAGQVSPGPTVFVRVGRAF
jgi:hypothetical protein